MFFYAVKARKNYNDHFLTAMKNKFLFTIYSTDEDKSTMYNLYVAIGRIMNITRLHHTNFFWIRTKN